MSLRRLLPWIACTVLLVLAVGCLVAMYGPAVRDLNSSVSDAERATTALSALAPTTAGALLERGLQAAKSEGNGVVDGYERALQGQVTSLRRWFPRVESGARDAEPERDLFRDAYLFAQEELIRDIFLLLREKGGRDGAEPPPLAVPAFISEGRLPRDVAEMRLEQECFHLEERLLLSAARAGCVPRTAAETRADYLPYQDTDRFLRRPVRLRLKGPEGCTPALLRALHEMRGEGPIVIVRSLAQRPAPLTRDQARPEIEIDVDLETLVIASAVLTEPVR